MKIGSRTTSFAAFFETYLRNRHGQWSIHVLRADGTEERGLIHRLHHVTHPSERLDFELELHQVKYLSGDWQMASSPSLTFDHEFEILTRWDGYVFTRTGDLEGDHGQEDGLIAFVFPRPLELDQFIQLRREYFPQPHSLEPITPIPLPVPSAS